MQPKFIYFDLGNVLVNFSVERMLAQVAAVAGVTAEQARAALFGQTLVQQHEGGQLSSEEFCEAFCRAVNAQPARDGLSAAFCDIFTLNLPIVPIVAQLRQAGHRLGVLSNTSQSHWEHCLCRYAVLREAFDVYVLSYRVGSLKPDAAIFRAAASLAGVKPAEIFYTDDREEHVAGARAVGFDAVQFTSAAALAAELKQRGVRFNY